MRWSRARGCLESLSSAALSVTPPPFIRQLSSGHAAFTLSCRHRISLATSGPSMYAEESGGEEGREVREGKVGKGGEEVREGKEGDGYERRGKKGKGGR